MTGNGRLGRREVGGMQTQRWSSLAAWLAAGVLAGVLGGCSASSGFMIQSTGTAVSLREDNYTVLRAGARGRSSGLRLLGFIPLWSPTYADAKADLYDSAGEPLEGRSIALANATQDRSTSYFILFSIPTITLSADIIEFTGPTEPSGDSRSAARPASLRR